ncbi:MAG: hypothetical protein AB1420_12035 [Bacillota bacterium]
MQDKRPEPLQRPVRKRSSTSIIITLLIVLVWAGLMYGGYMFIEYKMDENRKQITRDLDRSIKEVMETNALNIMLLEEKVAALSNEMADLAILLQETDESLTMQNYFREAINEKMEELTIQLERLEESLEMLKESKL